MAHLPLGGRVRGSRHVTSLWAAPPVATGSTPSAMQPLEAIRQFMAHNDAVIMMVVLLLIGAKLLGDGLAVL